MLIEIVTIILTIIGMFAFHTVVNCAAIAFFVCSRLQLLPEERVQRFFIIRIFLICLYAYLLIYAYLLKYAYLLALDLVPLTLLCRIRLASMLQSSAFGHTPWICQDSLLRQLLTQEFQKEAPNVTKCIVGILPD